MSTIPLHYVWHYSDVDRAFWSEHLDPWLPQQIFDAHTHVTDPRFRLAVMSEEKRRQYWVNEVAEPISAEEADRCYRTVFPGRQFNCLCFGTPSWDYDLDGQNTTLQAECEQRGWYQLVVVPPQWTADRIARELDRPRVLGIKVYYEMIGQDPTTRDKYVGASIFDFLPHHQLEVLNERHGWVTLHVPKVERLGHPANLAEIKELRRRYPNVVLVIAHLGRCYTLPHAEEAFPHLAEDPGIYFDSSAVLNPDVHRLALETFGPRRILYGTDNPIFYMRGRRRFEGRAYINHTSYPFYFNRDREPPEVEATYTLFMYEELRAIRTACEQVGLTRDDIKAFFFKNAQRLIASILEKKV